MADIVNLNRARKQRQRGAARQAAAENRIRRGRTRSEKQVDEQQAGRLRTAQDGARLDPPERPEDKT